MSWKLPPSNFGFNAFNSRGQVPKFMPVIKDQFGLPTTNLTHSATCKGNTWAQFSDPELLHLLERRRGKTVVNECVSAVIVQGLLQEVIDRAKLIQKLEEK